MNLTGIKTILLDLGGVTFTSTGTSNERIDWTIISKLNHQHGHSLNVGDFTLTQFLNDYNHLTGQQLSGTEFLKEVFDTLEFNEQLIRFLRPRYEIVIVSDNYRENIEYISQRYRFLEWSAKGFYSYDFKMVKSDPAFFPLLLQELKAKPEELLLIDDSEDKIDSAGRHGIAGIVYKSNEQVEAVLGK